MIPYFFEYLQQNFTDKIQSLAAECLFSLTFYENSKEIIKKEENMKKLFMIKTRSSKKTFRTRQNIIWTLNRNINAINPKKRK